MPDVLSSVTLLPLILHITLGCSLVDWHPWSMQKILYNQNIVVYGQETGRFNPVGAADPAILNAMFSVFCVLKNDDVSKPIGQTIIVEEVFPVTSCSNTDITTNTLVLLGLTRLKSGNFKWHEPDVSHSAAFRASPDVLTGALGVCGLRDVSLPVGRLATDTPQCPSPPPGERCSNVATNLAPKGLFFLLACLLLCLCSA